MRGKNRKPRTKPRTNEVESSSQPAVEASGGFSEDAEPGEEMATLAKSARRLVKICAGILALLFGWLKLSGVDFVPIAKDLPADVVLKGSMALYYACWVAGTIADTDQQERVYAAAPNRGSLPGSGLGVAVILAAVFGVMCWVESYRAFALALTGFLVVNVAAWVYLVNLVRRDTLEQTRSLWRRGRRLLRLEMLDVVTVRYLMGTWQWYRFATGFTVLALLNVLAFTDIAPVASSRLGGISPELLIAGVIFSYVVVMEGWIWVWRVRVWSSVRVLESLERRYVLLEKSGGFRAGREA